MATDDDNVYIAIKYGMYWLLQAGILTQEQLKNQLNKRGYH